VVAIARDRVTLAAGDQTAVTTSWSWPALAAVGGAVLLAAGLTAVIRGRRWPGMSARYDRPFPHASTAGTPARPPGVDPATGRAPATGDPSSPAGTQPGDAVAGDRRERTLWEALDRGVDPTEEPGNQTGDSEGRGKG
jgi:hypothetical protein